MFKTEYELFWVNLAMTSFMFRPDGYFSRFMKKIISAICRIGGAFLAHIPFFFFFFYRCGHLKYSESMHTAAVV